MRILEKSQDFSRISISYLLCLFNPPSALTLTPKSKPTIYSAIDNGLIPGVTRESLNSYMTTMFSDGQIHIAKWVRKQLDLNDGDELLFEIIDNKIVFRKAND